MIMFIITSKSIFKAFQKQNFKKISTRKNLFKESKHVIYYTFKKSISEVIFCSVLFQYFRNKKIK